MTVCQFLETKLVLIRKNRNKVLRSLKEYDLEIIADSHQKIVNDLDVFVNSKDGIFRSFHKLGYKIHTYRIQHYQTYVSLNRKSSIKRI